MSFFEVARQDPTLSTMLKLLNKKVVDSVNAQNKLTDSSLRQIQFPSFETLYINSEKRYQRTIAATQTFSMPVEPDGKNCVALIELTAVGNPIEDQSGFGNDAFLSPIIATIPDLVEGKPGTFRPANSFDGKSIWYYITDAPTLRLAGLITGFSIWVTVSPTSIARVGGNYQTIAAKRDDATNMWAINISDDGYFKAGIIRNGTETRVKSSVPITIGGWYDIGLTYSLTPALNLYVNKSNATQAFGTGETIYYPGSITTGDFLDSDFLAADFILDTVSPPGSDNNLNIGRATDTVSGLSLATKQFFRYYRDLVFTQTQVNNLYNNLWTIADISDSLHVAKWGEFRVV